jgi:cytochrome P450
MLFPIIYIVVGVVFAALSIIYLKLIRPQQRLYDAFRNQGIPCEPFIPIFGQLFDMIRANKENKGLEYFNELAQKHDYCFLLGLGPLPRFFLLKPELLADVFGHSNAENYQKTSVMINITKPLIGVHNLLNSQHQEHDRARKMLNPAFHFVNLQSIVPIMSNETAKAIDSLLSVSLSTDQIRLDHQVSALTLSIIASSAFGQSFENIPHGKETICQAFNKVKDIVEYRTLRMINQVKILDILPFWGKRDIDQCAKNLNDFVNRSIVDRRNGTSSSLCSGPDILDLLVSAVDDQSEPFTDQEIKDEALTFVLGGHDTTGNLLTWALYILMTQDEVLQACREEVDCVLPNGIIPTYEHIADLQVVEAILYETLRLYPSVPAISRQCIREHTIASSHSELKILIPVDTMIVIHTYSLHRREEYWPRPLEFDYKRWMHDPITGLKPKLSHPFAYLPFGAGSRNCIGQNYAIQEAKVVLAMFVQRCTFELVPGQIIVPEMKGVIMPPKYGIFARVKKRDFSVSNS